MLSSIAHPLKVFIVANTHIIYNSNRGDIKLAQIQLMCDSIHQLREHLAKSYEVNLIVCGDFNSTARSGIYEYMTAGKFDAL